jgi:hypothetical protein
MLEENVYLDVDISAYHQLSHPEMIHGSCGSVRRPAGRRPARNDGESCGSLALARRPRHVSSPEQMQVNVEYALAGVGTEI